MVWGGRLKDADPMRRFETISIVTNLIILAIVAIRGGLLKVRLSHLVLTIALFLLNTLGNLASTNQWERLIFTPLTFVLALLCGRLALGHRQA